jgi:ribosome-associated protein
VNSDRLAAAIAGYADDKKAQSIVELDLRGVIDYTDFFVICSGGTDRQVKAIHDGIHAACKAEYGILPQRVEGLTQRQWVLMDYLDVVVHVFVPEVREFYALERLWGEVPARQIGTPAAALSAVAHP